MLLLTIKKLKGLIAKKDHRYIGNGIYGPKGIKQVVQVKCSNRGAELLGVDGSLTRIETIVLYLEVGARLS